MKVEKVKQVYDAEGILYNTTVSFFLKNYGRNIFSLVSVSGLVMIFLKNWITSIIDIVLKAHYLTSRVFGDLELKLVYFQHRHRSPLVWAMCFKLTAPTPPHFISSQGTLFFCKLILYPFEARKQINTVNPIFQKIHNDQNGRCPTCKETFKQMSQQCPQQSMRNIPVNCSYHKPNPNSSKWSSGSMA